MTARVTVWSTQDNMVLVSVCFEDEQYFWYGSLSDARLVQEIKLDTYNPVLSLHSNYLERVWDQLNYHLIAKPAGSELLTSSET